MSKYVNFPLLLPGLTILVADTLDRQSLDDHFQSPIFFSTIAMVSLDIQSVFDP